MAESVPCLDVCARGPAARAAAWARAVLPALTAALGVGLAFLSSACAQVEPRLSQLRLPDDLAVSVFARVLGARSLAVAAPLNAVFVGTRGDTVYAAIDADRDGVAETVRPVLFNLQSPNGIAWHEGWLYVAEQHQLTRYPARAIEEIVAAKPEILFDDLPDKRHHGWRYVAIGPDRRIYVAVGSPCNICEPQGIEGTIQRFPLAGGAPETFARGIRNSVGLAFHPESGVLYFTDNGADGMGDDSPPDELNRADRPGLDFGFPIFGGGDHRTWDYRTRTPARDLVFPIVPFGAHVAALGLHVYRGGALPARYRGDIFVAQHGSWNRAVPDGYRIARVRLAADGRATWEPFIEGWLGADGRVWGRPVDVTELPDGSLIVSDDRASVIYRITARR
jgi:glucose/arabinose dehydrogenase